MTDRDEGPVNEAHCTYRNPGYTCVRPATEEIGKEDVSLAARWWKQEETPNDHIDGPVCEAHARTVRGLIDNLRAGKAGPQWTT